MNIPVLILIILSCISLGISIAKHGTPKGDNYNIWITFICLIVEWVLILWALGWRID